MFNKLYNKLSAYAKHRAAAWILFFMSLAESCVSPLSPMVMLIPMCLAHPPKRWYFALVATSAALIGSVIGYLMGAYLISWLMPLIDKYGYMHAYTQIVEWFHTYGLLMLLPASVFLFPPFKVFTIAAGAVHLPFLGFVLVACAVRFIHFALVPLLMDLHKGALLRYWEKKHTK